MVSDLTKKNESFWLGQASLLCWVCMGFAEVSVSGGDHVSWERFKDDVHEKAISSKSPIPLGSQAFISFWKSFHLSISRLWSYGLGRECIPWPVAWCNVNHTTPILFLLWPFHYVYGVHVGREQWWDIEGGSPNTADCFTKSIPKAQVFLIVLTCCSFVGRMKVWKEKNNLIRNYLSSHYI